MNNRGFKPGLEHVLLLAGFERHGKSLRRHDSRVWTLVGTERGLGQQLHINVGFWLDALGAECPGQVERTHLYFRLERVFPDHRETILLAGALDDPMQPKAFEALTALLAGDLDRELRAIGTEEGLRRAIATGRLAQGFIRKEARAHLQSA